MEPQRKSESMLNGANQATTSNVKPAIFGLPAISKEQGKSVIVHEKTKRPWWWIYLYKLGYMTMPRVPKSSQFNWQKFATAVGIAAIILGGFWALFDRVEKALDKTDAAGYQRGVADTEKKQLIERLDALEKDKKQDAKIEEQKQKLKKEAQ